MILLKSADLIDKCGIVGSRRLTDFLVNHELRQREGHAHVSGLAGPKRAVRCLMNLSSLAPRKLGVVFPTMSRRRNPAMQRDRIILTIGSYFGALQSVVASGYNKLCQPLAAFSISMISL